MQDMFKTIIKTVQTVALSTEIKTVSPPNEHLVVITKSACKKQKVKTL